MMMAATHSHTGPSRRYGVALTDLVVEHSPPHPAGGATAPASTLHAPLVPERARAAALQVAAALHSVNLFTRPVIVSDAETVARGRMKTRLFVVAFAVTVLVLVILNAVQKQTLRMESDWPDWSTYAGIQGNAPTCTCSNAGVTLGNVVSLYVPPSANYSANLCAGLAATYVGCAANVSTLPSGRLLPGCSATDAGALLWGAYLSSLATSCFFFVQDFGALFTNVNRVPVGATLPSNATFQELATSAALLELRLFSLTVFSLLEPLATIDTSSLASAFDLTAGARFTSPPNCTCAPSASASLQVLQPCTFHPAFDLRPTSPTSAYFSCNAPSDALFFPLQLISLPALYRDVLLLPPPYDAYTVGSDLLPPNATRFIDFLDATLNSFYQMSPSGAPDTSRLAPGFLTADYVALFSACAPATCVYVVNARPSALQVVTALLGLLSGLQTVLTLAIDRGYDAACACWLRRRGGSGCSDGAARDEEVSDDGVVK